MSHTGHSSVTLDSANSDRHPLLSGRGRAGPSTGTAWLSRRREVLVPGVPRRVLLSLMPPLVYPEYQQVYSDLKGPQLVVTILAAIIFYGLHSPRNTLTWELLVSARLSVGYWLAFSLLAFLLGRCFGTTLSLVQFTASVGYSLTGHCLVLFGAELLHQEESHTLFFLLTIVFGGLATGRLVLLVLVRTPQPPHRLLVCSTLASIHIMHLIYIHFACMRKKFAV